MKTKITYSKHSVQLLLVVVPLVLFGCFGKPKQDKMIGLVQNEKQADLKEILDRKKLIVLAENSANSYFIYRGAKMGMEYEILKEFAKDLGVDLEVKVVYDLDNINDLLIAGEGDIIACNYTVTKERLRSIDFSDPILRTSQVLIQRKPEDWKERPYSEWREELLLEPDDLIRKHIHVWNNSSYYQRLVNLQEELGDTIYIEPINGSTIPEEVIQLVAEKFIDYTVTDQNVAAIHQRFYDNIDAHLELSVQQKIAFGLRKTNPLLKDRLNTWLADFTKTSTFAFIKHKYLNMEMFSAKSKGEYSSIGGGKISKYDNIIQATAKKMNWDWRLITALIYQESKFQLDAESWAGAYGLMQFMPEVGPSYGVFPDSPAEIQIKGGIRKLSHNLLDWKSIPDSIQRLKFAIASYNAGRGHILDAQRLAEKNGFNPFVWDNNVENFVLKLGKPEFYQDEVVRHGYLRGQETYNYVRGIFIRYNEYLSAFPV